MSKMEDELTLWVFEGVCAWLNGDNYGIEGELRNRNPLFKPGTSDKLLILRELRIHLQDKRISRSQLKSDLDWPRISAIISGAEIARDWLLEYKLPHYAAY
jgi:hypothetical protein